MWSMQQRSKTCWLLSQLQSKFTYQSLSTDPPLLPWSRNLCQMLLHPPNSTPFPISSQVRFSQLERTSSVPPSHHKTLPLNSPFGLRLIPGQRDIPPQPSISTRPRRSTSRHQMVRTDGPRPGQLEGWRARQHKKWQSKMVHHGFSCISPPPVWWPLCFCPVSPHVQ